MENINHGDRAALARQDDLVVQELPDEVMVYDLKRHKAHCLNKTAAFVWRRCDGQTTVTEMARMLGQDAGGTVDEELVWYALDKLGEANLLEGEVKLPAKDALSRRRMMRRLGLGAMVAIPMVMSLVAPTAVQAVTVVTTSKKIADGSCAHPPGPAPNPTCFSDTCCTGALKLCVGTAAASACVGAPCQPAGSSSFCNA